MRILQINSVCGYGSTGRIAVSIDRLLKEQRHESFIAYGRGSANGCNTAMRIGDTLDNYAHAAMSRFFDLHCYGSRRSTEALTRKINQLDPDVIHLHNIHGYYLNMEVLFDYLKIANKPLVWTLHDCWAFTGHCAYFEYVACRKWKTVCSSCPQKSSYPASLLIDRAERNHLHKKNLFTQISKMTIVTPSAWLADLVKESFLGVYPVRVINNGVDLGVFRPRTSSFRQNHGLDGKFVVLGVANVWDRRKGLEYFIRLSQLLPAETAIVIVGVTKQQLKSLPDGIIAVERTSSADQLAEIYSTADVFINPTLEENFPTTNLEALACGTPVITFRTGGSAETISDDCGLAVEKGSVEGLLAGIELIRERSKSFYSDAAVRRAASLYEDQERCQEYVTLYEQIGYRS